MPADDGPVVFDNPGAPASTTEPPAADPAAAAASATDTSQVADATQEEVDLFEADPNAKVFDRDYVSKLRQENAKHRTDYQPYRDVYADTSEEARDYLLGITKGIIDFANGKTDGADLTVQELEYLLDKMKPTAPSPEELKKQAEEEDRPLTVAEWRTIQAKEDEDRRNAESADQMWQTVESLGYVKDIKADPYGETAALLAVATANGGDFKKAATDRAAHFEQVLEAEVTKRIDAIRAGTAKWPNVADGGGAPAVPKTQSGPMTREQRRGRLNAKLDSIFSAQDGTGGGS